MVAIFKFFIKHVVTLDDKGPFGEIINVFKILARYEFIFMVVFFGGGSGIMNHTCKICKNLESLF